MFQKKISKGTQEYSLFSCICIKNCFAGCQKPEKTRMFVLHYLASGIVLPFFFPFNVRSPQISRCRYAAIECLLRVLWNIVFTKTHHLRVVCFLVTSMKTNGYHTQVQEEPPRRSRPGHLTLSCLLFFLWAMHSTFRVYIGGRGKIYVTYNLPF